MPGGGGQTSNVAVQSLVRFPTALAFPLNRGRIRCAVVGSSGNLKGSAYGAQIDAHDLILRMNLAPLQGFEEDVGARTTHHFIFDLLLDSIVQKEFSGDRMRVVGADEFYLKEGEFLVLTAGPLKAYTNRENIRLLEEHVPSFRLEYARHVHPLFRWYAKRNWGDPAKAPSTGFQAVLLASHLCDEVNVYGFGANEEGYWDYYYDKPPRKIDDIHAAEVERAFLDDLEKAGIIAVHKGRRG